MAKVFPAHIRKDVSTDGSVDYVVQSVVEHCRNTAKYAAASLEKVGLGKTAYLAGLLHDCGKFTNAFKDYIEKAIIGEKKVRRGSVNHTFAGVRYILSKRTDGESIRNFALELISYAIGSHHGLFDSVNENKQSALEYRMTKKGIFYDEAMKNYFKECATEAEIEELICHSTKEVAEIIKKTISIETSQENAQEISFYYALLCRLLTSAVIDGDRTDTVEFEENKKMTKEKIFWNDVLDKFNDYISAFKNKYLVDSARLAISNACADAAQKPEGVYRLNVPTGGGKTLSSLRYALEHAQLYKKQRIFFIMPLLAIIEQNAKEIRKAIQNDSIILEHHSNVINEVKNNVEELEKKELLLQSWDAPIIITTLVQLLNTLFLGKTTSIRRFSSLCDSIIVFDEVQSVPNNILTLYNLAINFLVKICHATVILCSATQPCFEKAEHQLVNDVSNLITLSNKTLNVFKRVKLVDKGSMTMERLTEFASEIIASGKSLLLVCNLKREANELFRNLNVNQSIKIYHLSASMCATHREDVVRAMKNDLKNNKKIVCVSTQVIEAGVDISFDSVIRLQAGMDNIIQAAGRCNRNGENNNMESVYIVKLAGENLNRLVEIEKAKIATDSLLQAAQHDEKYTDLMSDTAIAYYYQRLYKAMDCGYQDFKVKNMGESIYDMLSKCNCDEIKPFLLGQKFKTAGNHFRVFDDNTVELIVPYGSGKNVITELGSERAKYDIGYTAEKIKEAVGYTVACYKYQIEFLEKNAAINYKDDFGIYVLADSSYYDENIGLNLDAVGGDSFFS